MTLQSIFFKFFAKIMKGSCVFVVQVELAGHILDLYCIQLLNADPFCENRAKVYFDAKHLEKGLNSGWGTRG